MKKCASCSKDLPEAALHCVFCGAKQPPAPAVSGGLAKTAFGYSANEVMDQLGRTQPQYPQPAQPAPYQPPRGNPPSQPPPTYVPPPQQPYQQYNPPQQGGLAPASNPHAATIALQPNAPGGAYQPQPQQPQFVPGQPSYAPPQQNPYGTGPMSGGMGINAPNPHTPLPVAAMPAPAPYSPRQHVSAVSRPVEPWRDSIRLHMIVWGIVAIGTFVAPLTTDPMKFKWELLSGAPAKAMVYVLLAAGIGALSILIALIPVPTLPRGLLAAILGLVGLFLPWALLKAPEWMDIVWTISFALLVIGLLVRNEYTQSLLARIVITVGVVGVLVPYLVPIDSQIPLVSIFKGLIHTDGIAKLQPIYLLLLIVLAVLALLSWMPGPATGGAKIFAWGLLLTFTLGRTLVTLITSDHFVDMVKASPSAALEWGFAAACYVLVGYGAATVVGKQLE